MNYDDRIARDLDGRALGKMTLTAALGPVRESFAYVWADADEARRVQAAYRADEENAYNAAAWDAREDGPR